MAQRSFPGGHVTTDCDDLGRWVAIVVVNGDVLVRSQWAFSTEAAALNAVAVNVGQLAKSIAELATKARLG